MKIKLRYFGMIAEALSKQEEEVSIDQTLNLESLKDQLEKKYPKLKPINYRFAINHSLAEADHLIQGDCEIALLPPFAGG